MYASLGGGGLVSRAGCEVRGDVLHGYVLCYCVFSSGQKPSGL